MFISEKPKPLGIIANLSFANSGITKDIKNMLMKIQKALEANLLVSMILKNKENESDITSNTSLKTIQ